MKDMQGKEQADVKNYTTIHIYPGPIYSPEETLGAKYKALSSQCRGVYVSTAPVASEHLLGDFKVALIQSTYQTRIKGLFRLLKRSISEFKALKKNHGDVIIVCYDPLKTGLIGLLIKTLYGGKLIVENNGVYNSEDLLPEDSISDKAKKIIYPVIQQFVMNRADGIKTLFKAQLDQVKLKKDKIISNFSNYSDVSTKEFSEPENKTVLSIGFPLYRKGLDLLVEAFSKSKGVDLGWKLHLVGHLKEEETSRLKELASHSDWLEISEPVGFEQIPSLIDTCSIFVLASRSEAMGRVLVESMARSKPRIGSNIEGIPSVINHGEDGLLFTNKDVTDLTNKLDELIESPESRERLARAAFKRFNTELAVEHYANRVFSLYEKVSKK